MCTGKLFPSNDYRRYAFVALVCDMTAHSLVFVALLMLKMVACSPSPESECMYICVCAGSDVHRNAMVHLRDPGSFIEMNTTGPNVYVQFW